MGRKEQFTVGELWMVGIPQIFGLLNQTVVARNALGYVTFAYGATMPVDATAGFATGCIWINTTNGAVYFNVGSETSCNFDQQGTVTAGSLVNADINANAGIVSTKLAVPRLNVISQAIVIGDFTDDAGTSGHLDLSTQLPAGAVPIAWEAIVGTGFTGDTTAVLKVGISGTTDLFSVVTTTSVLAAASVGCAPAAKASTSNFCAAATTVRLTITGSADFTSINAGAMTFKIWYLQTA